MSLINPSALLLVSLLSLPAFGRQPGQSATLPSTPGPARDADGNYQVGGGVTAPRLIFAPEPEFSEAARKKKIRGNCIVGLVVYATGHVKQAHVVRSIAEDQSHDLQDTARSLDGKALEAVRQYRFEPVTLGRKPVPITMTIEVNFQIF